MRSQLAWSCALFSLLSGVSAWPVFDPTLKVFPSYPANGSSTVQYAATGYDFDGPKADVYNASAFQWWYFDVVSDDLKESLVLIFFTNGPAATGAPVLPFNIAEANLQLSNGTLVGVGAGATSFEINTVVQGSSGVMNGTGYSWLGAPDLSSYVITINDELNGLYGTVEIYSDAPYHASCGPATAGANLEVAPVLGWANSVPDGLAIVNLKLGSEKISYVGRGYHDSNWGQIPMQTMGTYYWGHAKLGPYALVWFDMLNTAGTEYQLGYLSENGAIVANSCGSIQVRATGGNSTYPPNASESPTGFHILYDMGHEGILEVNLTNTLNIQYVPELYNRWVGSVSGGIKGKQTYAGVGLYEWMIGYNGSLSAIGE